MLQRLSAATPHGTNLRAVPLLQAQEAEGCRMAVRWPDSWGDTGTHLCLKGHHHKNTWPAPAQWHLSCGQLSLPLPEHAYIKHLFVSWLQGPVPAASFFRSAGDVSGTLSDNLFRVCSPTFPSYSCSLVFKTVTFI